MASFRENGSVGILSSSNSSSLLFPRRFQLSARQLTSM